MKLLHMTLSLSFEKKKDKKLGAHINLDLIRMENWLVENFKEELTFPLL